MPRPLVLALLALTLLAGCGGSDGDDGGKGSVSGTGYALDTPGGWQDRSDQAEQFAAAGFTPDVVLTDEPAGGFTANINVLRQASLADGVDADRLAEESRKALADPAVLEQLGGGLAPKEITDISNLELDGEAARSFDYSSEREGRKLRFRQVYAVREGTGYVITYTGLDAGFEKGAGALDDVIGSWRWE